MFIAHYFLSDEKLNPIKIVGATVAIVGATTLLLSNTSGLAISAQQGWVGQMLIIFSSLTSALGVVYTRVRLRAEDTFVVTAGQVLASLVVVAPLAFILEGAPTLTSYAWQGWVGVIVATLCGPVAVFWLVFYMINKYSASLAGFAGIATPFFSIIIGILFLGEVLTVPFVVGTFFLVIGVWSLHNF